jgi:hypothetical protein
MNIARTFTILKLLQPQSLKEEQYGVGRISGLSCKLRYSVCALVEK